MASSSSVPSRSDGFTRAALRDALDHLLARGTGEIVVRHLAVDEARRDGVDANAVARPFQRLALVICSTAALLTA